MKKNMKNWRMPERNYFDRWMKKVWRPKYEPLSDDRLKKYKLFVKQVRIWKGILKIEMQELFLKWYCKSCVQIRNDQGEVYVLKSFKKLLKDKYKPQWKLRVVHNYKVWEINWKLNVRPVRKLLTLVWVVSYFESIYKGLWTTFKYVRPNLHVIWLENPA